MRIVHPALVVNDRLWDNECEAIWQPAFSPDNRSILIRSLEDGVYCRRVLPVTDFTS